MRKVVFYVILLCSGVLSSFATETHIIPNFENIHKNYIDSLANSKTVSVQDSLIIPDTGELPSKSKKSKKSFARKIGLTSFVFICLAYLSFFISQYSALSSIAFFNPILTISLIYFFVMAFVLAFFSFYIQKKQKTKKGKIWNILTLIMVVMPIAYLLYQLFLISLFIIGNFRNTL